MTSEKTKRKPRIKTTEPNLLKVGNSYYYRKGKIEESLGTFRNDADAVVYKRIFEAKIDSIGALAFKFKAKDVWPDYEDERNPKALHNLTGRKILSDRSFDELQMIWNGHLKKFFSAKKLAEIDSPLWTKYVKESTVSDLTNHRKVLTTFLKWCSKQGYLRVVPIMEVPKVKRRQRSILKPDQISILLENCHGPLLLFVAFYLFMGVRWAEIIQLKWESVDLTRGFLSIKEETSRTRKARSMVINAFTLVLLKKTKALQLEVGIDSPWVFPMRGRPQDHRYITSIHTSWVRMNKRTGLGDVTPHDLRATFEYFANKRADFTDTQREKMAGAAIEVQRKHYVRFEAEDVRGLEEVVVFPGIESVLAEKLSIGPENEPTTGKTGVSKNLSDCEAGSSSQGKGINDDSE